MQCRAAVGDRDRCARAPRRPAVSLRVLAAVDRAAADLAGIPGARSRAAPARRVSRRAGNRSGDRQPAVPDAPVRGSADPELDFISDPKAIAAAAIDALATLGFVGVVELEEPMWRGLSDFFGAPLRPTFINTTTSESIESDAPALELEVSAATLDLISRGPPRTRSSTGIRSEAPGCRRRRLTSCGRRRSQTSSCDSATLRFCRRPSHARARTRSRSSAGGLRRSRGDTRTCWRRFSWSWSKPAMSCRATVSGSKGCRRRRAGASPPRRAQPSGCEAAVGMIAPVGGRPLPLSDLGL